MSMRPPAMRGDRLDDPLLAENNLSDDDNAQPDMDEPEIENEDPLLLAIDDLEGRVVATIDEVKLHPGVRTDAISGAPNIHEELAILLRPVLEVAAHTGPSVARTYYRGSGPEGIEASVEDAYERTVSDLVLPVMLEMAQSDLNPAKRCASLEFFRALYKECHKAGSWLDSVTIGPQAGPYGPGGSHHSAPAHTPAVRATMKRRQGKRLIREGEMLRYWIEAAVACLLSGVLTDAEDEGAVVSRGIIAASAALRPSLRHISQRIRDADDRGAARLYTPVMKMVEGVLRKLLAASSNENVRSSCIKFLEIVILCCSQKPPQNDSSRKKDSSTLDDFSLDDLPTGHPSITRADLESIAEYAFVTLRGLTMVGGQVKIDNAELNRRDVSSSEQVISMLKTTAYAYLEIESTAPKGDGGGVKDLDLKLDRSSMDLDFTLSQKAYALVINAVLALALNRPAFFLESALCLARRAVQPPVYVEGGHFSKTAVLVVSSQLRSSCLTLLRHASSITTGASEILYKALTAHDMELQAEKALKMANQANELKTAGRAARNQAKMFYEWDASESDRRSTKRQKETDDALAKMRAAKRQRGLGGGIQLPSNMTDAIDLILLNLTHLPKFHPSTSTMPVEAVEQVSLEYVIDAIMTNGASLLREEGRWYDRNGGTAWTMDLSSDPVYQLSSNLQKTLENVSEEKGSNLVEDQNVDTNNCVFFEQCNSAASDAFSRVLATAGKSRSKSLSNLGSQLAARLAFTLKAVNPAGVCNELCNMAKSSVSASASISLIVGDEEKHLNEFISAYPLVASSLALTSTVMPDSGEFVKSESSLSKEVLNEAYLQALCSSDTGSNPLQQYETSLHLYLLTVTHASQLAREKPNDSARKQEASYATALLRQYFPLLPRVTEKSLVLLAALCDVDDFSKKSSTASQDFIAASASAKAAAEKRATAALLILRDVAFQRDALQVRDVAIKCAVGVASGRLPASVSVHDKALKLTINVLYSRNEQLANSVTDAARADLEWVTALAIEQFDAIQLANKEAHKPDENGSKNPLVPRSDKEKQYMEKMKKPAVLFMALCARRPEMMQTLFHLSCQQKADILSKAVRLNMAKLSKALASSYGVAAIALRVAEMAGSAETPMLLAFLENLVPNADKTTSSQEIVDACFQIQELKRGNDGQKDARYLIPIVSVMKRIELMERLPEFVSADDNIFLASLVRMGDRVGRLALQYREESDPDNPSLFGMTLCEQLVCLHRLDFQAAGLPQKQYLAAIKICLENDDIFSDRVLMSAIDEMSGQFLAGTHKLPLAFMRTNIIVCSKHESLHSWFCHVLLPRLVEGKIWNDARQWEGWMRCAHMLEKSGDPNVTSMDAIEKLPSEHLMLYRSKWAEVKESSAT